MTKATSHHKRPAHIRQKKIHYTCNSHTCKYYVHCQFPLPKVGVCLTFQKEQAKKQTCKWHSALWCSKGLHKEILIPYYQFLQHASIQSFIFVLLILINDTTFCFIHDVWTVNQSTEPLLLQRHHLLLYRTAASIKPYGS